MPTSLTPLRVFPPRLPPASLGARLSLAALVAPCAVLAASAPPSALREAAIELPSVTAEHVRRHEPSDTELLRARVELSPEGLRVRRTGDGSSLEMLQDFADARAWLIDRDRRVAFELPLAEGDAASNGNGDAPTPGFLGRDVCGGATARDDGSGRWRGRSVRAWSCVDDRGTVTAIELVDEIHRIVVVRRTRDGVVDELRTLRPMRFAKGHFSPPSRFRAVDDRELFHGTRALELFVDGTDEP